MLSDIVTKGTTDYSTTIRIVDSGDGTPETGVVFNTAGIDLWYRRPGSAHSSITEVTQTEGGAHTDGGFVHISDGYYRLDLPDAALASGADYVDIGGTVTGMVVIGGRTALTDVDLYDGVRGGMSALPNAAADAAGGLVISDAGGLDIDTVAANVNTDGVALSTSTVNTIADQVHDEPMSGHVASGSFGAANPVIRSSTAQAGAGSSITLDASADANDDFYNNTFVFINSGTGVGQGRFITDYNGTTKVADVDAWIVTPDNTSVFTITPFASIPGASAPTAGANADAVLDELLADHTSSGSLGEAIGAMMIRTGTAQAGGASTITLDASASATNDLYNFAVVTILSGTGAGQTRQISDYVGSSKVATVSLAWTVQPDATSVFAITPLGVDAATVASIAAGVWDRQRSASVQAGSFGERVNANVTQISDDTAAADNLEAYTDGTTAMPVNMSEVSGDAAAADNFESMLDGTGGVTLSADVSGSVGSVTGGLNTAGTITTLDALDTAQDSQHGTTQSAVSAVDSALATVDANVDAILVDTSTTLDAALALVDSNVDAIKAKTDQLIFTVANQVDANTKSFNDTAVIGVGTSGDKWRA